MQRVFCGKYLFWLCLSWGLGAHNEAVRTFVHKCNSLEGVWTLVITFYTLNAGGRFRYTTTWCNLGSANHIQVIFGLGSVSGFWSFGMHQMYCVPIYQGMPGNSFDLPRKAIGHLFHSRGIAIPGGPTSASSNIVGLHATLRL